MQAQLVSGDMTIMASDGRPDAELHPGDNFSLSISGDDDERLSEIFNKLAEGGKVTMALEKQVWGDKFGSVQDKYGMSWMININHE
mgnify:CR=1 FL=1